MTIKADDSAYPHREYVSRPFYHGLTKREHFAGLAMQGMLANSAHADQLHNDDRRADLCVVFADALIAALNEQPK